MKANDIIKKPHVTEKGMSQVNRYNAYPFIVDCSANKLQIAAAIEELFNVKVEAVRTMTSHAKSRRSRFGGVGHRDKVKKAFVKLHKDHTIDFI